MDEKVRVFETKFSKESREISSLSSSLSYGQIESGRNIGGSISRISSGAEKSYFETTSAFIEAAKTGERAHLSGQPRGPGRLFVGESSFRVQGVASPGSEIRFG